MLVKLKKDVSSYLNTLG